MSQIDSSYINQLEQGLYNCICNIVATDFSNDIDEFCERFNNVESFLSSKYGIAFQHFSEIPKSYFQIAYQNVRNRIEENQAAIHNSSAPIKKVERQKTIIKRRTLNVAGFVDTLILAFITGSFIGIIILNIYSKIVQNI
ncbi:MAG: hypothetical protein IJR82_01280 [Bacilli bacterium]|nr:hypothetical protein [Bacilli bacterium]